MIGTGKHDVGGCGAYLVSLECCNCGKIMWLWGAKCVNVQMRVVGLLRWVGGRGLWMHFICAKII